MLSDKFHLYLVEPKRRTLNRQFELWLHDHVPLELSLKAKLRYISTLQILQTSGPNRRIEWINSPSNLQGSASSKFIEARNPLEELEVIS